MAGVRATVDRGDVLAWYDEAMGELHGPSDALGRRPAGPPGGLYDHALFTDEHGQVAVYLPVDGSARRAGRSSRSRSRAASSR